MDYTKSKKLVKKIIQEETKQTGIEINILPLTYLENVLYILKNEREILLNPKYLNKKTYLISNFDFFSLGYYEDSTNKLKIFLSKIYQNKKMSPNKLHYLINLLQTTYHEYNHKMYYEKNHKEKRLTKEKLIFIIEEMSQDYTAAYKKYYDNFYIEIIANLYSVQKTKEFLKQYQEAFSTEQPYLDTLELIYSIKYINYDFEQFFYYFTNVCKIKKIHKNKKIDQTLITDTNWDKSELPAKYLILSSRYYQTKIDINSLTKEELKIMLQAFQYALELELEKEQKNQQLALKLKDYKTKYTISKSALIYIDNLWNSKQKRNIQKKKYLESKISQIEKNLSLVKVKKKTT